MATTPSDRWVWLIGAGIILTTSALYLTYTRCNLSQRLEKTKSESGQSSKQENETDRAKMLEDSIPQKALERLLRHQNSQIRTAYATAPQHPSLERERLTGISAERIVLSRYDNDPANAADLLARLASPNQREASHARTQAINLMYLREELNRPGDLALANATRASLEAASTPPAPGSTATTNHETSPLGSMHGFRELRPHEPSPFAGGSSVGSSGSTRAESDAGSRDARSQDSARRGTIVSPFLWQYGGPAATLFHNSAMPHVMTSDVPRREALRTAPASAWKLARALREGPWLAAVEDVEGYDELGTMEAEEVRDQMWVRALMVSMASDDPFDQRAQFAESASDVEMTDGEAGYFTADEPDGRRQGSLFVEELETN